MNGNGMHHYYGGVHHHHHQHAPDHPALPPWLARLLERAGWRHPQDQEQINAIFAIGAGITRKIDAALSQTQPAPGGPRFQAQESSTMVDHTIADALAAVTAADTRVDSLLADRASLKDQLAAALANAGVAITPEMQAAINSTFDISTADAAKIDAALNTNVPPPAPAPAP